jgi:hypothetical protein
MAMKVFPSLVNGRFELLDEVHYGLDLKGVERDLSHGPALVDQGTLEVL